VLTVLAKATDPSERSGAEKALSAISARGGDEIMPLILDAMKGAAPEPRIALLNVLARIGGPKPLEAVLTAFNDSNAQISEAAVHLLADWQTLDAAPAVLKLAQSEDLNRQVLGLRGYVRLAEIQPAADEKARMLTTVMGLAKRPDEKKLALGAWGKVMTEQSLDVLRKNLDDAAVQNEAASAIVAVAPEVAKNPASKPKAAEALKAVTEKCTDPGTRDRALLALATL
jgi:HEAT repeat protein